MSIVPSPTLPPSLSRLLALAKEHPDREIFVTPALAHRSDKLHWETLTFGALDRDSDLLAGGLARAGVQASQRVFIALPMGIDALSLLVACWKIGAIVALPDPRATPLQWRTFVSRVAPEVFVGTSPQVAWAVTGGRRLLRAVRTRVTDGWRWCWRGPTLQRLRKAPPSPFPRATVPDGLILLEQDEGSTLPIVLGHQQLAARAEALVALLDLKPGQHLVVTEPWLMVPALLTGATLVLPAISVGPYSAMSLTQAIRERRAEQLLTSADLFRIIKDGPADGRVGLDSLRTTALVCSRLTPHDAEGIERISPQCRLLAITGDIEAFPIAILRTDELRSEDWERMARGRGWCVGRQFPGHWLRVTRAVEGPIHHWSTRGALADGDIGEIVVGGTIASTCTLGDEKRTRRTKIQYGARTLHRTGWIGSLDSDGRLWVRGRSSRRFGEEEPPLCPEAIEIVCDGAEGIAHTALAQNLDGFLLSVQVAPWARYDARIEAALRERLSLTDLGSQVRIVEAALPRPPQAGSFGRWV